MVLHSYIISISKFLVAEFMTVKVSKVIENLEKPNTQINTKHSKANRLQKTIEYKTNK